MNNIPDPKVLARASALTGGLDTTALLNTALRALIERESARHLAALGSTEPDLDQPPRRRWSAIRPERPR